jgi:hypothetical protein
MTTRCFCAHCGSGIEFEASEAGQVLECPNCAKATRLPSQDISPSAGPALLNYVTCPCQHCNGHIEFDAVAFARAETVTVECPHCKLETTLFLPNTNPPEKLVKVSPKHRIVLWIIIAFVACVLGMIVAHVSQVKKRSDTRANSLKASSESSADNDSQHIIPQLFKQGDIKVEIDDIVHHCTTEESPTERGLIIKTSNFLLIKLSCYNTSSNRIYDYTTLRNKAVLTDNKGNNYAKLERFANRNLNVKIREQGTVLDGWVPPSGFDPEPFLGSFFANSSRIWPSMGRTDMLGFDIPDSPGNVLYLQLSADNFGGTGTL